MLIIIAVLLFIPVIEIYPGTCSTSNEGGTQSDISIESENYTCSKKLGPIYIHVFNQEISYYN
jgi:hypothetical protein